MEKAHEMTTIREALTDSETGEKIDLVDRFINLVPEHARAGVEARRQMSAAELAAEAEQRRRARYEREQEAARRRVRAEMGLKGSMWNCTFDAFEIRGPSQHRALQVCRRFVRDWDTLDRGFVMWGRSGVGKSHLLRAICLDLIAQAPVPNVVYIYCAAVEEILREERRSAPETSLEERMLAADVLALDDIEKGLGGGSAAWASNCVKRVIDAADAAGKPRIIATSEFSLEEHDRKGRLPEWLISRMASIWDWLEIAGPNGRRMDENRQPWWAN